MELPPPDMTYHVRKRRIRRTRVATAAIMIAEIMTGDAMTEVNDKSVFGSIESIHESLVLVGLDGCWESC